MQMKKKSFLILFNLLCLTTLSASTTDSISTIYKNSEYVTYCQVWVKASDSISYNTALDYDNQMRYDLDALFSWALKGMNLRKEKNELMMFYLKSTSFNKETNVLKCDGDVIVPGLITIPNIIVESQLSSKVFSNGKSNFKLSMLSAKGFIRSMYNSFSVIPTKNKGNWYILETHVKFGWFFDIFITQSRFKAIMEWRLKRFMHNLRDEAEKREKISVKKKL